MRRPTSYHPEQRLASGVSRLSELVSSSTNLRCAFCFSFSSDQSSAACVSHTVNCARGCAQTPMGGKQDSRPRQLQTLSLEHCSRMPCATASSCPCTSSSSQLHLRPEVVIELVECEGQAGRLVLVGVVCQVLKHVLAQAVQLQVDVVVLCRASGRGGAAASAPACSTQVHTRQHGSRIRSGSRAPSGLRKLQNSSLLSPPSWSTSA